MRQTTPKEIEAVLKLDGPTRAKHFVKRVLDAEAAWSLWKDGWPLLATSEETPVLPLWPAREYAELHRDGDLAEYELDEIQLEDLLDNILPMLAEQGVLVGIFPTQIGKGVPMKADELAAWLQQLDAEYYGQDYE